MAESVFDPIFLTMRRGAILGAVAVFFAGIFASSTTWLVTHRTRANPASALKDFVDNAILVAQKGGAVNAQETVLALGQLSRPPGVEFFVFNGENTAIFSSRVEMNLGLNFSTWLVAPDTPLAALIRSTPPGGSKHFWSALQPIGGWKPRQGHGYIAYIPGSTYFLLAQMEGTSRQEVIDLAVRELTLPFSLSALFALLVGGGLWLGAIPRRKWVDRTWEKSVSLGAAAIGSAISRRGRIQSDDKVCREMAKFLERLRFIESQLRLIAERESLSQSAEESARGVLNAVQETIFVIDDSNHILWANRRAEGFMEANRAAMIGSPLALYSGEPGMEKVLVSELRAAREGSGRLFNWSCRKIASGQVVPVEVWASKISLYSTDAICISVRDISPQRKTEAELKRMVQDLQTAIERGEASVRSQRVFLARTSHEIRAPINAVIGLCQLGRGTSSGGDKEETLSRIEASARDLLRVVEDLLDCAKFEAGKISLVKQPFDLGELLDQVKRFCKVRASGRPLHFDVSISEQLPKMLLGDTGRIKQVLINFCENAIKFTQAGVIAIEAQPAGDARRMVRFSVTDLGIGIPASKQHQLFKDFSQADAEIGRQYGGSGLGLSICKMLVDAMLGTIGLVSEEGHGSTFWFEIPLEPVTAATEATQAPEAAGQSALPQPPPAELKGLSVLLADDEEINRTLISRMLESAGCIVEVCRDGIEAFEKILHRDFDCALFDLEMPEMDGFRTMESIRKLPGAKGEIPAIAMSSHLREHVAERISAAGFMKFIGKPVDAANLFDAVAGARWMGPEISEPQEPATTPDDEPKILNSDAATARMGGDTSLYRSMLTRFDRHWCSNWEATSILLLQGGQEAILAVHTLRGAAANIGAQQTASLAESVERELRSGVVPTGQISALGESLKCVHESAETFLQQGE